VETGGRRGDGGPVQEGRLVRVVRNKRVRRMQLPPLKGVPHHKPKCEWAREHLGDPAGAIQFDRTGLSGFK